MRAQPSGLPAETKGDSGACLTRTLEDKPTKNFNKLTEHHSVPLYEPEFQGSAGRPRGKAMALLCWGLGDELPELSATRLHPTLHGQLGSCGLDPKAARVASCWVLQLNMLGVPKILYRAQGLTFVKLAPDQSPAQPGPSYI